LKKALLILGALLMVVSGVAAVSAYEAHIIDIKAHVENAILVEQEKDLGVVFPEELIEFDVAIGLSESFLLEGQDRVSDVKYVIFWEDKPIEDGYLDPDDDGYFEPLEPYLLLSTTDTNDGVGGTAPAAPVSLTGYVAWGEMFKYLDGTGDLCDAWHMTFDVPVFDAWYNPDTDPQTPSGILVFTDDDVLNDDYVIVTETFDCAGRTISAPCPHADLGSNLKIQVYKFSYHE